MATLQVAVLRSLVISLVLSLARPSSNLSLVRVCVISSAHLRLIRLHPLVLAFSCLEPRCYYSRYSDNYQRLSVVVDSNRGPPKQHARSHTSSTESSLVSSNLARVCCVRVTRSPLLSSPYLSPTCVCILYCIDWFTCALVFCKQHAPPRSWRRHCQSSRPLWL